MQARRWEGANIKTEGERERRRDTSRNTRVSRYDNVWRGWVYTRIYHSDIYEYIVGYEARTPLLRGGVRHHSEG